jgi:hypothetical protein
VVGCPDVCEDGMTRLDAACVSCDWRWGSFDVTDTDSAELTYLQSLFHNHDTGHAVYINATENPR